jgi:hypothetical protein
VHPSTSYNLPPVNALCMQQHMASLDGVCKIPSVPWMESAHHQARAFRFADYNHFGWLVLMVLPGFVLDAPRVLHSHQIRRRSFLGLHLELLVVA